MKPRSDTPATVARDALCSAWAGRLHWSAFVLLLACMATRPFLSEITYRTAAIPGPFGSAPSAAPAKGLASMPPERMELARISFAAGILLAVGLWLAGQAANGDIRIRHRWLTAMLLLFALLSLASALNASNRRCALDAWVEQISLLAAAVLAAQLCTDRRRFLMVVVVLTAVAGALATKGGYQRFVEHPQLVADFEAHRVERLAQVGAADGSPRAVALANRVRDPAVTGFIAMANVFASTLQVCLMAAAGLAAWKIAAAMKLLPAFRKNRKKGEIHLPLLAATVSVLLAAAGGVVLIFTRSTGGIAAFIVALPICGLVYRFRETLAKRWKICLLAFGGLLLAAVAAVAACGLAGEGSGNLGHMRKTLLFRWLYWEASAKIVRDHPALGVGPANFGTAYPQYRDVRGEEAVKTPHNFAMQVITECGLPGGLCYLAVLSGMLVCACRPGSTKLRPAIENLDSGALRGHQWKHSLSTFVALPLAVPLAVLLARSYFAGAAMSAPDCVLDALLPAMALAAMLAAAWWCSRLAAEHADFALLRVALGGGVAAFLFYEVISFNLTMPSAAAVFFLALGAMMGQAQTATTVQTVATQERPIRSPFRRWTTVVGAVALVVAVAAMLWWPVYQRTRLTVAMQRAYYRQQWDPLAKLAAQAARADELDPVAAADAARAYGLLPPGQANLRTAYDWAKEAIRRDGQAGAWQQLAGVTCWRLDPTQATAHMKRAVNLDPQDLRLRLQYADMLARSSQPAAAMQELDAAEAIDRGLLSDSTERLNVAEREYIRQLRQRARNP